MTTASNVTKPLESFADLFEESLARQEMRVGEVITAEVVRVDYNIVVSGGRQGLQVVFDEHPAAYLQ